MVEQYTGCNRMGSTSHDVYMNHLFKGLGPGVARHRNERAEGFQYTEMLK